jgi:hypothetical protein
VVVIDASGMYPVVGVVLLFAVLLFAWWDISLLPPMHRSRDTTKRVQGCVHDWTFREFMGPMVDGLPIRKLLCPSRCPQTGLNRSLLHKVRQGSPLAGRRNYTRLRADIARSP